MRRRSSSRLPELTSNFFVSRGCLNFSAIRSTSYCRIKTLAFPTFCSCRILLAGFHPIYLRNHGLGQRTFGVPTPTKAACCTHWRSSKTPCNKFQNRDCVRLVGLQSARMCHLECVIRVGRNRILGIAEEGSFRPCTENFREEIEALLPLLEFVSTIVGSGQKGRLWKVPLLAWQHILVCRGNVMIIRKVL
jgi:hypothetical protein